MFEDFLVRKQSCNEMRLVYVLVFQSIVVAYAGWNLSGEIIV